MSEHSSFSGPIPIEIKNLTAGYEGETVLEDINLRVEHGEFFGLIGPNGGGKTTLLKALLGLIKPSKGRISIYGEEPDEGRKHIGYVPQYALFDREFPIKVKNVVMMGRRSSRGMNPWYSGKDRDETERALQAVDMWDMKDRHMARLSGGQKQRVFIARALASRPKLLLLDEPTASVDARIEESIYELLAHLNEEMTIVLVTHDIGVVSSHVGSLACINRHLFKNDEPLLTPEMLEMAYQCPVDLIAHGVPHRVLPPHDR